MFCSLFLISFKNNAQNVLGIMDQDELFSVLMNGADCSHDMM